MGAFLLWAAVAMVVSSSSGSFLLAGATDHIVGANRGWQVPANAGPEVNLNYTVWAQSQTFYLGDEVSFHYPEGMYTVFQVNYSVYTNCTMNVYYGHDWIYNWTNKGGRTVVPLNHTMVYYFVDGSHCQEGMKVAVNVTTNSTSTSPPSSSSSSSSSKNHSNAAPSQRFTLIALATAQAFLFISVWLLYPAL